ncbi:MAG: hypothetical protein II295_05935, partial [Akkermansia sp.]|nr:hypothetical protein [Akkermansia sp.]
MKLHLPRTLRTAVLTCMAVAGGFATTTATGVLATGSLLVAFATPQAQAAVDYSVYADASYENQIYQWTGSNSGIITTNSYYKETYDASTKTLVKDGNTAYTGWTARLENKVVVFDANSTTGIYDGKPSYAWDHGALPIRGIVVKNDASSAYLVGNKTDSTRGLILGSSSNVSNSIFDKTFTINTRGKNDSFIRTIGTQTWQVAEGSTLTLISKRDIEQNGKLSISGGTVAMNTKVALGSDSTTSINENTTLTFGVGFATNATASIMNSGVVNINGNITLTGSLYEYAEKQAASKTYSLGNGDGYLSVEGDAQYWIVQGTGTVTLASGVTITDADGNAHAAQQDGNKGLYFSMTVDEDTQDFYITSDSVAVDMSATGAGQSGAAESYVLNGGTMKLSGGTLAGDKVRSLKDSTIDIAATGVLTRLTNVDHTVTLTGSGTYDMGNSAAVNVAGITDSAWQGTVALGGGSTALSVTDFSFNAYGNAGSIVEVCGVSGWLTIGKTYSSKVVFSQNAALGYAMSIINGGSGAIQTFAGAVEGDGTLKISYPGGNNTLNNMHFNFTGDVSGWASEDGVTTAELYIQTPSRTAHVDFSGSATEINTDTYVHQGTLNLSVTNDKAVTLNGALTQQGGDQSVFNVTVANSADTTLYNTVNVSTLTNRGTGAIVVGSKVVDGVTKTGALTVTGSGSLGALTLDGGTAEVAGASSISTLSVLAESATPALTAKGTLTLGNVEVDCTGWTGIALDKVYTLATVDGGSLNWADTTQQSVSGIDGALALDGVVSLNDAGELVLSFSKKTLSDTAYWD